MDRKLTVQLKRQLKGIGLPAAIFVITLMSVIAAAVFSLVSQNAQTYSEEINLTRSFYAAESGAGFMMNRVFPPESYPAYTTPNTSLANCPIGAGVTQTFTFIVTGLNQCVAVVSCAAIENSGSHYATIRSVASCGDVTRTVQVRTVF
jgi:MSHA biogenesis protein MshP